MLCHRQDSLFQLSLSLSPLSLCVAYIVLLRTWIHINTPRVASPKGRQIGPHFPFVFVCVSGQPRPLLCLVSSLFAFPRHARSSDPTSPIATRYSRPRTRTFRSLDNSSPTRLDHRPVTSACGSGNNKPRTPLPVTLARVPSSGTSLGFYFCIAYF